MKKKNLDTLCVVRSLCLNDFNLSSRPWSAVLVSVRRNHATKRLTKLPNMYILQRHYRVIGVNDLVK